MWTNAAGQLDLAITETVERFTGGVPLALASEQERIQARGAVASGLALKWPVHLMVATQESAATYADYLIPAYELMGVRSALLHSAGSDSARSDAYQAEVLIGAIGEFMADADRGLRIEEKTAAVVEGDPPTAALQMLSRYVLVKPL